MVQTASIVVRVFKGRSPLSPREAAERLAASAPSKVFVRFDGQMAARCLWDYGEDALVQWVLALPDAEFEVVQRVATVFNDPARPLPLQVQRITKGHVIAFAVVTYFEGLRPLARTRRRPAKDRPHFT